MILRPSYALSGAAMRLIYKEEEFTIMLTMAADVSPNHPVCVSIYIEDAVRIDFDGVCQNGNIKQTQSHNILRQHVFIKVT